MKIHDKMDKNATSNRDTVSKKGQSNKNLKKIFCIEIVVFEVLINGSTLLGDESFIKNLKETSNYPIFYVQRVEPQFLGVKEGVPMDNPFSGRYLRELIMDDAFSNKFLPAGSNITPLDCCNPN